jgi:orotidine-5'-phosphate decarboxylase
MGIDGLRLLEKTIDYIRTASPTNIIIGDAKRGDIGPSGSAYAKAMFEVWDFDAVTINAWGGYDTVDPFISDEKRGAFIWCRGSNPGSGDLQDLKVDSALGRNTIYEIMAQSAQTWNYNNNIGLVVGATVTDQLKSVRDLCPKQPILIPGVGAQGGDLSGSVLHGVDARGRLAIINSSRGIIYASQEKDFDRAARQAAAEVNNNINSTLETSGYGWP